MVDSNPPEQHLQPNSILMSVLWHADTLGRVWLPRADKEAHLSASLREPDDR